MKVAHAFDPYHIPENGIVGKCHLLREEERAALMEYCVASLPECYITKALLRRRIDATGKSASELLANKIPDRGSVMSGDFGEIVTLFFLGSECQEKVKMIRKWRYKQDRKKPTPHSDVIVLYREFGHKPSAKDFVITAETKQKATASSFKPIAKAIAGIAQDQTGRLARTLTWLREKAIDQDTKPQIAFIERFTHDLSVTYAKHFKAVAVIDQALLDGELTRQPVPATDRSFEVLVIGIKDLQEFYEAVFERTVKEVTV